MKDQESLCFYGTRVDLSPGEEIRPDGGDLFCTRELDAAIWAAELADGEGLPRVFRVAPKGSLVDLSESPDFQRPPHPSMTLRTTEPLVVLGEVTSWNFYHGTKADLRPGDLIAPGFAANHGPTARLANYVYFTKTLDASIWGAELAVGEGPGRIYIVEPIGEYEDDPNLTNMKFKGNPTKSFRSRDSLRVVAEVDEWKGHDASIVRTMKESLQRLAEAGVEPED